MPPSDDGRAPARLDADVAIIGGGYTGLSCAYFLARHYGMKPVVLEANVAGWGCSGRNGGFARAAIGRHRWASVIAAVGTRHGTRDVSASIERGRHGARADR